MANLIRGLQSLNVFKAKEEKIMIFGNDACGKTTLLYQLKLSQVVSTIPTIGFNIETIKHRDKTFEMWDVGGCDKIRPLWRHYVAKDTSIIYVHNVIDERLDESLEGAQVAAAMMNDVGANFMWIVFNKQDLLPPDDACATMAEHRREFEMTLTAHAPRVNWQFVDLAGFSAYTGMRCLELLDVLHDTVLNGFKRTKSSASSAAMLRKRKAKGDAPTEDELVEKIRRGSENDLNGEDFWLSFLRADIAEWNHRTHLRAGYFLLLDSLLAGEGIFQCAARFLEHIQCLKEASPDRFRNTEHRTMTIFWLYNLQLAILNCKSDKKLEQLPTRNMFDDVLLHSPYLMYGGLWKDFYTKDLMMSPEAKQYWRLPDLQPLPDFAERTETDRRQVRRLSQEEPYRLMRFAFAVVQKYMSSGVRRGWLVKQSLAALQTTTMRIRAQNPDMRPYSETQAYFWIQIVHAALSSSQEAATKSDSVTISVEKMSFSSFRVLFDMDPSLWRTYYTPHKWDSVEARVAFVLPDLQLLPNIISLPSSEKFMLAAEKQAENAGIATVAEIPSMEELAMNASILLGEIVDKKEEQTGSSENQGHAHMLRFLFDRLVSKGGEPTPASKATIAMLELSSTDVLTLKAFWVQQVLTAVTRMDAKTTFEDFIRSNLHLVYQDLPLCYFSTTLLQSMDAKEKIMAPDKRKLKGFLPDTGSDLMEGEWVVM